MNRYPQEYTYGVEHNPQNKYYLNSAQTNPPFRGLRSAFLHRNNQQEENSRFYYPQKLPVMDRGTTYNTEDLNPDLTEEVPYNLNSGNYHQQGSYEINDQVYYNTDNPTSWPHDGYSTHESENICTNTLEHVPRRVHSMHRNVGDCTRGSTLLQRYEARTGGGKIESDVVDFATLSNHANRIVSKMKEDPLFMQDSPNSEMLRREALRDMPQCLTVKRCVRRKLDNTICSRKKRKSISCYKMFKYQSGIFFTNVKNYAREFSHMHELWYNSMKKIEGRFGSGVASYFKFFRWLFVLNCLFAIPVIAFIVLPQAFHGNSESITNNFSFGDIFTGEGYFNNTLLFYGYYSNQSVSLSNIDYSMPDAYFFTMVCSYLVCFFIFSYSVAGSYKRSFIETEGGLKNVYAHKIFCGWDYTIATNEAADLKKSAIYNELKELLFDLQNLKRQESCLEKFWIFTMQMCIHVLVVMLLSAIGYLIWNLLKWSHEMINGNSNSPILTAIIVNLIMMIVPVLFSFIVRYERYKTPRTSLYITLFRTFILGFVIIVVLMKFWLSSSKKFCLETSLGQEIYRLILFDFVFSILFTSGLEVGLFYMLKFIKKGGKFLDFDIARHTMQAIFNQTLFWVGLFYSPLLCIIVILKLWITWYIQHLLVLRFYRPPKKTWRAVQMQTYFLMTAFLSLMLVIGTFGYILLYVPPSKSCGPFRDLNVTYNVISVKLEGEGIFWKILQYVGKPAVVFLVLAALCVRIYYVRAKALAQRDEVENHRNMLRWDMKDKEFLLQRISKVTKGKWQYNLQDKRAQNPINALPRAQDIHYEDNLGEGNLESSLSGMGEQTSDMDQFYKKYY